MLISVVYETQKTTLEGSIWIGSNPHLTLSSQFFSGKPVARVVSHYPFKSKSSDELMEPGFDPPPSGWENQMLSVFQLLEESAGRCQVVAFTGESEPQRINRLITRKGDIDGIDDSMERMAVNLPSGLLRQAGLLGC